MIYHSFTSGIITCVVFSASGPADAGEAQVSGSGTTSRRTLVQHLKGYTELAPQDGGPSSDGCGFGSDSYVEAENSGLKMTLVMRYGYSV